MEKIDGSLKLKFAYDYMGRRYSKKVYEKDETNTYQLNTNNSFIYDGYKQVVAIDQTANVKTCTYWVGEQIVATKSASLATADLAPLYFYLTDANKNVCALVSESGEVAAKYDYTPFGKLVNTFNNPNSAFRNPFLFSSEYFDEETGLVYYNYRYYNPELGRWVSCDPIGEEGGLNLYGFVDNDFINFYDILGRIRISSISIGDQTLIGATNDEEEFELFVGDYISHDGKRYQVIKKYMKEHNKAKGLYSYNLKEQQDCWAECLLDRLGLISTPMESFVVTGLPLLNKPFRAPTSAKPGSITYWMARKQVLFSKFLRHVLKGKTFKNGHWSPTFMHPFTRTKKVSAYVGRWLPWVGAAFLTYDAVMYTRCMCKCKGKTKNVK